MPRECGCQGANENCTYCYGSGYVGGLPSVGDLLAEEQADATRSAQRLEYERSRAAGALRYALAAEERTKAERRSAEILRNALAEERTKAEEQASALRQALSDERRSTEILRNALAEERTKAEEQASALCQALPDERRSAGKWRAGWEGAHDEWTKAENRAAALAKAVRQRKERSRYGLLMSVAVIIGFLLMKSCF